MTRTDTTDLDLLYRAVEDHPGEDVPLQMLADAYRERGDEWNASVTIVALAMRVAVRDLAAKLAPALEAARESFARVAAEALAALQAPSAPGTTVPPTVAEEPQQ